MVGDRSAFGRGRRGSCVEVDGERYEVWVRGRARRLRVATWQAGDACAVAGERQPRSTPSAARRVAWQHVVGELDVDWLGDVAPADAAGRGVEPGARR